MKLTVVGCGDAFGSGGRLQTGYLVDTAGGSVLIDCGATSILGLKRLGRDPNAIPTIVISHLHGDHFSGLVWWLIHGLYEGKRTTPLDVFGPPGIEARVIAAAEALFRGSTTTERRFVLSFHEMHAGKAVATGPFRTTAFEVQHPSGAPSHGLRFEFGKTVLAFTGDSEWTESLVPCGAGADLYIMECYRLAGAPRSHMSWDVIRANLDRIGARRVMLTHMGDDMLAARGMIKDPRVIFAEDGLVVAI